MQRSSSKFKILTTDDIIARYSSATSVLSSKYKDPLVVSSADTPANSPTVSGHGPARRKKLDMTDLNKLFNLLEDELKSASLEVENEILKSFEALSIPSPSQLKKRVPSPVNENEFIERNPTPTMAAPPQYKTDMSELLHICESCSTILKTTEEGFLSCPSPTCGRLYTNILDQSPEWKFFGNDTAGGSGGDDPTRCGLPINPLFKESSLGCRIAFGGGSARGTSYEMRKIKRYTEWQSMTYKEKIKMEDFQRISIMSQTAGINESIIDCAIEYHQKISKYKTFRKMNRDAILAASIYIACRENQCPRTAKEIAQIFNLESHSCTKGCKNAMSIINNLEMDPEEEEGTNAGSVSGGGGDDPTILASTTPTIFIERYCSQLSINQELTNVCKFVSTKVERNNLIPENTPNSVAAGILYFVANSCKLNTISKKEVHRVSNISDVTITKIFNKLVAMREQLIPEIILKKYANNYVGGYMAVTGMIVPSTTVAVAGKK